MKHMGTQRFMAEPLGAERLTPGVTLRVELDQSVDRRPGPYLVGRAEVLQDGRLAIWLTEASEAGRTARGLLADDVLDVVLWGSRPVVRLR
jgi:hypothetical protein